MATTSSASESSPLTLTSSAAAVSLCEVDSVNFPTSTCTALTAPDSFPAGTLVFTAPANTILTTSTTYAMVVRTSDAGGLGLARVESDDEDAGGAAGWTIDNGYMLNPASGWANTDTGFSFRITITGTAVGGVSTDATLTDLVVNDGNKDLALTPTFASGMYAYDASVASTVTEVTVTPTTTDDGATIEWLDASNMTLDDADTTAGQQVMLARGRQRHQGEGDRRGHHHHPDLRGDGEPAGGHAHDLHAEHRRHLVRGRHGGECGRWRLWIHLGWGGQLDRQLGVARLSQLER